MTSILDTIFLDVDGVLADCVTPAMEAHGSRTTYYSLTTYDMSGHVGMTHGQFWEDEKIMSRGFWAALPKLPWADGVVELCESRAHHVAFLTQPIRSSDCLAGKRDWLHFHFPGVPFFISDKKVLAAGAGKLLIDDYDKNVDGWRERGGEAILFPAGWNALGLMNDPISYVEKELDALVSF